MPRRAARHAPRRPGCAQAYDYLIGGLLIGLCLLSSATVCMKHVQNRALLSGAFNQVVVSSQLNKLLIEVSQ